MNNSRYSRQLRLPGFGKKAQERLGQSKVLVVGLGGLGVPVMQYLNAMGVGTLGLVDFDTVDNTNLHRQVIYTEDDLGKLKTDVAKDFLSKQNSLTSITTYSQQLDRALAKQIFPDYDVIVDATDNFDSRYIINDAAVKLNKPVVYGALHGFEGQMTVFNYKGGPTYRCLFPQKPGPDEIPDCNTHGVIGVLPGIVGSLQALEVVKICTGVGQVSAGKMLLFNGLNMDIYNFTFSRRSEDASILNEVQRASISAITLKERLDETEIQLIDVRTKEEFDEYHLPGSINLPLNSLTGAENLINPKQEIYVICESGTRSRQAQEKLQLIYPESRIVNVLGGLSKFRAICY